MKDMTEDSQAKIEVVNPLDAVMQCLHDQPQCLHYPLQESIETEHEHLGQQESLTEGTELESFATHPPVVEVPAAELPVAEPSTTEPSASGTPAAEQSSAVRSVEEVSTVNTSRSVVYRLYISHFLSTWNSRMFEFGAVLFLAAIYPGSLTPMSIYALVRSASAILLAPAIGNIIDTKNRLSVVRFSIVCQRIAVIMSCVLFYLLALGVIPGPRDVKAGLLGLTILACVEKLCSVMNLVSVERDWVVVITGEDESARQVVNARMRRIDLFCKLLGPLAISMINAGSLKAAILITLAMNSASIPIEYMTIATVFRLVPSRSRNSPSNARRDNPDSSAANVLASIACYFKSLVSSMPFYFRHPAFHASFALALLYLTVLSFSGPMISFLLFSGFTSAAVGGIRTASTIFELSATWIAPRVMKRIGTIRAGIWFLNWQLICLAVGVSLFWTIHARIPAASSLVAGVAMSRIGLWGYDLSAQAIVQDRVQFNQRGAFSTTEASFQNLFELLSYVATIVFSQPDQFKWPVIISTIATYAAGALYTFFVKKQRGHLVHFDNLLQRKEWHTHEPSGSTPV